MNGQRKGRSVQGHTTIVHILVALLQKESIGGIHEIHYRKHRALLGAPKFSKYIGFHFRRARDNKKE